MIDVRRSKSGRSGSTAQSRSTSSIPTSSRPHRSRIGRAWACRGAPSREGVVRSLELALDLGALVIENGGPTTAADRACLVRPIRHARVNLRRVAEISALAERARVGAIGEDALEIEIGRIERLAPPYDRWTMLALAACVTGAFSLSQGGDWTSFVITAGAATAGQLIGAWLQPQKPSAGV